MKCLKVEHMLKFHELQKYPAAAGSIQLKIYKTQTYQTVTLESDTSDNVQLPFNINT